MRSTHLLLVGSIGLLVSSTPLAALPHESSERLVYVEPAATQQFAASPLDHVLTFAIPVGIPGANLPPGTYIFRFMTPSVLQVLTAMRTRVYATFFTIRADGAAFGDPDRERMKLAYVENGPPRIVGWYLPGSSGYEFVYAKGK